MFAVTVYDKYTHSQYVYNNIYLIILNKCDHTT